MQSSEARRLSDLLDISRALASTPQWRAALQGVLDVVTKTHGAVSAVVVLLDEEGAHLRVEASVGLSATVASRTHYALGEGITGRVAQSGRPIVVPQASKEPLFLDRTGVRKAAGQGELTYVCVPIALEGRSVGALGVTFTYRRERHYEPEAQFLAVVAAMVGQGLRAQRLLEVERRRLADENAQLREELKERHGLGNMVGHSRSMQQVYEQVAIVAPANTTVLLRGESGTGKELVAQAVHYASPRAAKPFIRVSCGALPESLIESELFGYEPGAFTDARTLKKGRFELAHGGTLFLDEVGELSLSTQVKLLRVLQEREFERLGGIKPIKVDVRLITATNADLEKGVQAGTFRSDLYYRLNVFSLFLPPLRERKPDIPLLADHFVEKYAATHGKEVRRLATSAIDMLMSYHWPGNVRELENCIERAVLVCESGVIHGHHLPPTLQTAEVSGTLPRRSLTSAVEAFEKDLILDALKIARGNKARAARLLDTTERIVGYKVAHYGIETKRFR
jgi:Nif-specific regulatory protein